MLGGTNLGTLLARIGLDTQPLSQGLSQASQALNQFGQQGAGASSVLGGLQRGSMNLGRAMSALGLAAAGVGGALGSLVVFKEITSLGVGFELQMTRAGAVASATTEELAAMTEITRELGATTEFTATQAAEALTELALKGFSVAESMSALPGVLDLATAAQVSLAEASDTASSILRTYQLDVEELGRVNDVLVGTANRTATGLTDLSEAMKYAAPVAAAFGYSIEETSAMLGLLGDRGIRGSMAGTQLRFAIQRANEAAAEFGFTNSDLVSVLEEMRKRGMGAADIMEIFGQRGGLAALIFTDLGEEVHAFGEELRTVGGESKTLADTIRATLFGQFKALQSIVQEIGLGTFEEYSDELTSMVTTTVDFLRENKEEIQAFLGDTINAALELLSAVGSFLGGFVEGLVDTWSFGRSETDEAFADMATIVGDFVDTTTALFTTLGATLAALIKTIVGTVEIVIGVPAEMMAGWHDLLKGDVAAADEHSENIKRIWSGATGEIADAWTGAFHVIEKGWSDAIDSMAERRFPAAEAAEEASETSRTPFPAFNRDKPVGGGLDDESSKAMARAQKEAEKRAKALLEFQADTFRETLESGRLTASEMASVWEEYENVRLQQIERELAAVRELGASEETIALARSSRILELAEEEFRIFSESAERIRDVQIGAFEGMVDSGMFSSGELRAAWDGYHAARLEQIAAEAEAARRSGVDFGVVAQTVETQTRELQAEQMAFMAEHGTSLTELMRQTAVEAEDVWSTFFFDAMRGEADKTTDYLGQVFDMVLMRIAERAGSELSGLFSGGGGGPLSFLGDLFGGGDSDFVGPPKMAEGGLVTRPMHAIIGEAGPELVVPLDKFNDPKFARRMGGGGQTKQRVIHQTNKIEIKANDPGAFLRSGNQILTRTTAAMRRNMERN